MTWTSWRLIECFRNIGLYVGSVVLTRYQGQPVADAFQKRLEALGVKVYRHYSIEGYPSNISKIVSDEGYGKNEYIETTRELVVVTGPRSQAAGKWQDLPVPALP